MSSSLCMGSIASRSSRRDLSSLESVRAAVAELLATESRLDVLVDNAGAINTERRVTEDGLEATFATMVAGPFTLIDGLLPMLEQSGDGRVINVVSGGMYGQPLPLDDLQFERGTYDGTRAYARAKRASTALMREWSRRYQGYVRFDAMHPGWADTPGLAESLPGFYGFMEPLLRTPAEGADTIVWLATDAPAAAPQGPALPGPQTATVRPHPGHPPGRCRPPLALGRGCALGGYRRSSRLAPNGPFAPTARRTTPGCGVGGAR